MAKRTVTRPSKAATSKKKTSPARTAAVAVAKKAAPSKKKTTPKNPARSSARKKAPATKQAPARAAAPPRKAPAKKAAKASVGRVSSIDSRRRELEAMVPSPPSSLNMNRRGSAVRTGRDEIAEHRADHATMTPSITGGDVDANVEDAYFSGDEAPGGDNSTPDQDIVDDIGKALGVEYQDNEELRGSDKVADRDKHRWELDPASAEDYRARGREKE